MSELGSRLKVRRVWAVLWTIGILVACFMPTRGLTPDGDEGRFLKIPHLDKVIHLTLFLGFALLWRRAGVRTGVVLVAGLLLAVATEYVQGLPIVGRDSDLVDAAADFAGVLLGCLAHFILQPKARDPGPEGSG